LQNRSQINGDNVENVRCDDSRTLRRRKKEKEYLKDEINELETNGKNKNI
jgi:hypothetical protein